MLAFIFGLILLGILLLALSAQKTYSYLPLRELKRQARTGDSLAQILYGAASYGFSLRAFLWLVVGLSAAGSFMLLQAALPGWLTFITLVFILLLGFMWLPASRLSGWGAQIVAFITPAVTKVLHYVHPMFDKLSRFIRKHRPVTVHTGLYEREDLLTLLDNQAQQPDSRIDPADLSLAAHVLTFGDQHVRDCLTPQRVVTSVNATASIGPVLMGELHESGHSRFPVYDEHQKVVGILYLRDITASKQGGSVRTHMRPDVYYVHEDHTLRQVLHAFLQTKHHLFIVVNEFEEYVGIITIEDVMEQIIGEPIVDEFDRYDDMRAVAASQAVEDHADHAEPSTVVE
ncbi:MAG: exported protein of unknown function [Candidatus Saccharibacteria bacterium]|nr:exported protein of unknown function [Candidatus Saccharibacteria bacterium]